MSSLLLGVPPAKHNADLPFFSNNRRRGVLPWREEPLPNLFCLPISPSVGLPISLPVILSAAPETLQVRQPGTQNDWRVRNGRCAPCRCPRILGAARPAEPGGGL